MRRGRARTALLVALVWPCAAAAADLAYVGQSGALAEQAAEASRSHTPTFDRSVALATISAVADAVRSGQAAGGMITAVTAGGMPIETKKLLLDALDTNVRIVGATRIEDASGGVAIFWVIARSLDRMPDLHPDRIVVNVEAPGGSKAFSLVVAGLSKLGFTVTGVTSVPLSGKSFGTRYMLVLAADKPILVLRATDAIARDSRVGAGRALLIGAWKQGP
jgi:prephenate dehydratase